MNWLLETAFIVDYDTLLISLVVGLGVNLVIGIKDYIQYRKIKRKQYEL